jgi:lysophospholipase
VVGYDNVGFVFGTSSSLFNAALTTLSGQNGNGAFSNIVLDAIKRVLTGISQDEEDIADWVNPFYGYNNDTYRGASDETLTLVDGGEDGMNIPLVPLIQPNRNVDIIFAIDSSADTNDTWPTSDSATGWPNGVSMATTYDRSMSEIGNGTVFPAVPDINTFLNLGLNNRPTFFGCNASNMTGQAPLIVYMPSKLH